ncbi:RNA polymerase sigma factor SigJ [Tautonia plasticadhaerens]|uniref:ECF RNA polymerase sigma factor SigJ n=1 Tax=Tautonia plasticadhaerens TaxID=2527974 RepID=A0A518GXW0_9BACT|nr:RNA polymerase sigma factor SigJ [Tautonia plasticadhaerens]QDV33430.1 ECF RNA polymerase sigma factor SigJ [Tautonia plasticadhaerens]
MTDDVSGLRPRMMSVAYRMLGSVADAEDAVQDAFLRYQTAGGVSSPEGFLVRTTTRICLDRLRERKRRGYIGPWVPEPVETRDTRGDSVLSESLTQAFLLLLERLTPGERAAFLLRTVFDYEYAELGEVLGKSEAAVRQLVSRARRRLGLHGDRLFPAAPDRADGLAERFLAACRAGDVKAVEAMLAEDVEVHSDGGGKATAARVVIRGRAKVARFLAGVFRKPWLQDVGVATVNGEPGLVFRSGDAVISVLSLRADGDVRAVYITVNPDKLGRWAAAEIE